MKYELIPGDSWLWWPVLVTSRRKHVKLVYTGRESCDDFGELMLRSMLQVDAEIIIDRSWTIRDEIGVQKPSSSLHVFMLGVLHGRTCLEAHARAGGYLRQRTGNALGMVDWNRCEPASESICIDSEVQWKCGGRTSVCNFVRAS